LASVVGSAGCSAWPQPDEPAQGHVARQLHYQLAITGHPEQVAADEGQEQLLGGMAGRPIGE
jgi:hypothetical protein